MLFPPNRSRPRMVLLLLIAVLTAMALVLLGRMTAPSDPTPRTVAGVPIGFPRSVEGARAAGLTYATTRARTVLLNPTRRHTLLEAIATPAFARAAERQDGRRDLAPLASQAQARYLVAGLGTRILAYTPDRARLLVWLFQAFGADTAVGAFATQTVDLVWTDDGWRLNRQRDATVQAVPEVVQTPRRRDVRAVLTGLQAPGYSRP